MLHNIIIDATYICHGFLSDGMERWRKQTVIIPTLAGVAERSKAADCKSAGLCPTKVRILSPAPSSVPAAKGGLLAGAVPTIKLAYASGYR